MTRKIIVFILCFLLLVALLVGLIRLACPKPNPGKPVPAAVDMPPEQAQD